MTESIEDELEDKENDPDEADWSQCTVCVHYDEGCTPPNPNLGERRECWEREIDPKRWKEITGEDWVP